MERVRQFFSAILAGMLIGMGGTVFLSQSNPVVGSFLFAIGLFTIVVRNSRIYEGMAERVAGMAEVKLSDDFTSIFLLAVFCGMLMFIAVDCFRNVQGSTLRFIGVFVPVMVFILSGFEHVIANMFYFSLSGTWSAHCFVAVLVMTLGNAVGGMLIPIYLKVFKQR